MRLAVLFATLAAVLCACGAAPAVPKSVVRPESVLAAGVDRPGEDYRDFDLAEAQPEACRSACLAEDKCLAWTYVRPGIQSEKARCWLKQGAPSPISDPCCVSGKRTGPKASSLETSIQLTAP